jgi:TP901-1 family phage major tail protein
VFLDDSADERAWAYFLNADIPDFQFVIPGIGVMTGAFQITGLEYSGDFDGEATYEITLTSGGIIEVVGDQV